MIIKYSVLILLLISIGFAEDRQNQNIIGINKEGAHCTMMPYNTIEKALAGDRYQSNSFMSLNGAWKGTRDYETTVNEQFFLNGLAVY